MHLGTGGFFQGHHTAHMVIMAVGEENVRQGCVILFQLSQIGFGLGSGVHHNGMPVAETRPRYQS